MAGIQLRDVSGDIFKRPTAKKIPVIFYPYNDPNGLGMDDAGTKDGRPATTLKIGNRIGVVYAHFYDVKYALLGEQPINSWNVKTAVTGRVADLSAFESEGFKVKPVPLLRDIPPGPTMNEAKQYVDEALERLRVRSAPVREEAVLQL